MLFARLQMELVLISLRASGTRLTGNIELHPSLPRSLRLIWRGHYAEFKPASGDFWSACLGTFPRPAALLGASLFPARLPRHAFPTVYVRYHQTSLNHSSTSPQFILYTSRLECFPMTRGRSKRHSAQRFMSKHYRWLTAPHQTSPSDVAESKGEWCSRSSSSRIAA